jgi:hypothetical protein
MAVGGMSTATADAPPLIADKAATRNYFEGLYGSADAGFLPIFTWPNKRTQWFPVDRLDDAAAAACALADQKLDVYHGMGLHRAALTSDRRGAAEGVCALPGLYMDVDVKGAGHTQTALPESIDEVVAFLDDFPLLPSLLNFTGGGIHVHWLLREVQTIYNRDDRAHIADVLRRLQAEIQRRGREHGWAFESTADLARVLRPAGTINHKGEPVLVRILHESGERYLLEEIEDVLPDDEPPRRARTAGDDRRATLAPILKDCAFLAHCRDDAATLPEPEWHAALTIVSLCENGEQLAHEISEPYPRYSHQETQKKYDRSRAADKPIRCATVEHRHGDEWCAGCAHRGKITSPIELGYARIHRPGRNGSSAHADSGSAAPLRLSLDDFVAHLEAHKYLYRPTGKLWPRVSVNAAVPPVCDGVDEDGKPVWIPASDWLDAHASVHQVTWSPGDPEIIEGRLLNQGGWIERPDFRGYNLYRPPTITLGDPGQAGRWVDHVHRLYPDDAERLIQWFAHRAQHPARKVNHALLLGGPQGCGKDTILKPVREAVGPWNFAIASPPQVVGRFSGFLRSVVLLIPELYDLGDINKYAFYEHVKPMIAAPPDMHRCDEKFLAEVAVPNVTGVVFTSNQRIGIYLPAGDRRHLAAWSELDPTTLPAGYFDAFHRWLDLEQGSAHVAAYLHAVDLAGFNPNAPPPKTEWFWSIVDAGRAPEESELSTLLDAMSACPGEAEWPEAVTLAQLVAAERDRSGWIPENGSKNDFASWLDDRKNRRQIPHRMEAVGYVAVRNDGAKDGLWKVGGARMAVYAKRELERRDQLTAVNRLLSGPGGSQ